MGIQKRGEIPEENWSVLSKEETEGWQELFFAL